MQRGQLLGRVRRTSGSSRVREASCCICGDDAHERLCAAHDRAVASTPLLPEQVRGPQVPTSATLIGAAAIVVGVSDGAVTGRHPSNDIAIAHASMSLRHARFVATGGTWVVEDLGSDGGTAVDGRIVTGREPLRRGAFLRLGGVGFYFVPRAVRTPSKRPRAPTPVTSALVFRVQAGTRTLTIPADPQTTCALVDDHVISLTRREHRLLCLLAERRASVAHDDRAYVSTAVLAEALDYAIPWSDENVRELVYRVRTKLSRLELDAVVDSHRGAGYRLRGVVTLGA